MTSRFIRCSTSFLRLIIISIFLVSIKSQQTNQRPYIVERPDTSVYGQDEQQWDAAENMAGFLTGGLDFLIKGGRMKSQEVLDTTPQFTLGETYDFIVVGAGTAGAAIASRLSEIPNVTVLLIEAGGDENLLMDVPALANFLQFSNDINWHYRTESSNTYCLGMRKHRCNWPRGRVMGGSSVLNYMIATRGNKHDYDQWSKMGNEGWSWDDVLPYFKKLETMSVKEYRNDTYYHNFDGPVNVDHVPYHSTIARAFVEAGEELGWNSVDYNGETQTGFSYVQTTTKDGTRHSSNRAYIHPARERKNLIVTKRSLATRILIDDDNKRAIGVEFIKINRIYQVYARKEVILSAGAIGSPQLLMLSGVGPAEHLKDIGIKTVINAPVGENLMDHISYGGLVFLLDQPVGLNIVDMVNPTLPHLRDFLINRKGPITTPGASEGIAFINVDNPDDPFDYPNVELFFVGTSIGTAPIFRENVGLDEDFWRKSFSNITNKYSWTIMPMLMRPKSRGKILLRNDNVRSHPRIIPNYMSNTEDVRLLIKGIRFALKVAETKSMRRYGSRLHPTPLNGCEGYKKDSDAYWECALRSFTMNIYHYSGTCKMGPENDTSAVVNPRLQVIGISGLRVADASIMPEIPTGHTNVPTYMIAEKLADMVKQDWGHPTDPLQ